MQESKHPALILPRVNVSIESLDAGPFFLVQDVHVVAEDGCGEYGEEDWAIDDGSSSMEMVVVLLLVEESVVLLLLLLLLPAKEFVVQLLLLEEIAPLPLQLLVEEVVVVFNMYCCLCLWRTRKRTLQKRKRRRFIPITRLFVGYI